MSKEQVRRINIIDFEDMLKEFNFTITPSVLKKCRQKSERDFINVIQKAYEHGFNLEEHAKESIVSVFSYALLYNADQVDRPNPIFDKMYYTAKISQGERIAIVTRYNEDKENFYIPRTLDEIYHTPGFYNMENLTKKIKSTLNNPNINIEDFLVALHIKKEHTLKGIEAERERVSGYPVYHESLSNNPDDNPKYSFEENAQYRTLRIIQADNPKDETFFYDNFDYEKAFLDKMREPEMIEALARFLLGHERRLEINFDMQDFIGEVITLNGEIHKTKSIQLVLNKDGYVEGRKTPEDYMRSAKNRERKIDNKLGTKAVTFYPFYSQTSVSTGKCIPYSYFEKNLGKEGAKYLKSPLYRTYMPLFQKYRNSDEYHIFFRKNVSEKTDSKSQTKNSSEKVEYKPQISIAFEIDGKKYNAIIPHEGDLQVGVYEKDNETQKERLRILKQKEVNKLDIEKVAFLNTVMEIRDRNKALNSHVWGQEMTDEYREMTTGFGLLDNR